MKNVTFAVNKHYFYSPFPFFCALPLFWSHTKNFLASVVAYRDFYVLLQIIFNKNNQFIVVVLCSCHKLVTWVYGQNANVSAYRFRHKNEKTERQLINENIP